jgi:hypothetical protein
MRTKSRPERDCRHEKKVGGHDLARVIREKRSPRLGRWTRRPSHVLSHARLTHRDPELHELAVSRGVPTQDSRWTCRESARTSGGTAGARWGVGFFTSRTAESCAGATRSDLRLDNVNGRPPAAPRAREPRPQPPVCRHEAKTWAPRTMDEGELVSESDDFQVQHGA